MERMLVLIGGNVMRLLFILLSFCAASTIYGQSNPPAKGGGEKAETQKGDPSKHQEGPKGTPPTTVAPISAKVYPSTVTDQPTQAPESKHPQESHTDLGVMLATLLLGGATLWLGWGTSKLA